LAVIRMCWQGGTDEIAQGISICNRVTGINKISIDLCATGILNFLQNLISN